MMFLIRMAFWLMILVLVLPTDAQQQSEVFGTAEAAVKDVSGFCERNPNVCVEGKEAFDLFMQKAEFGVNMVVGFVQNYMSGEGASGTTDAEAPSRVDPAADETLPATKGASLPWLPAGAGQASRQSALSQNTLLPSDLEPAWAGPERAGG